MRRNINQGGAAAEARKTQERGILGSKMKDEQRTANCCPSRTKNDPFIYYCEELH